MDHSNHTMMDHSNHTMMDHSNHTMMDHSNHTMMDHSNHGMMDHSNHGMMGHDPHSMMDHSNHSMMDHSNHSMMDHSNHTHMMNNCSHTMMGGMDHSGHGNMHSGHDGHLDAHAGHSMKMYFHGGVNEFVLFKECETNTTEALVGACFIIFAVAVLYEGLKFLRESLLQRSLLMSAAHRGSRYQMEDKHVAGTSQEQMVMQMKSVSMSSRMLSCGHLLQTFLHIVQVFISYCLMLVFMTYNVWLCLAVVAGAGVGYFLFGWRRAVVVDANEHCH